MVNTLAHGQPVGSRKVRRPARLTIRPGMARSRVRIVRATIKLLAGSAAPAQRRNVVLDYLPVARRKAIDKRLAGIFANADADAGVRDARRLAEPLRRDHPDAAGSLLEGLEEMFTVARLGITRRRCGGR